MRPILYLLPYILSAAISLGTGLVAWRRSAPGSRLFAAVAFSEAVWAGGYACQLAASGLPGMLFWNNVQFLGAVAAPLAYLGFAVEYNRTRHPAPARISWKGIIPLAALLLVFIWTDGLHGWFRGAPQVVPGSPFNHLVFPNGPGFMAYTLYAYSLLVLTTLIFISRYIYGDRLYRRQIGLVLAGVLIPWVTSLLSYFELIPITLHHATPVTFGICNLVIAWALYRYRLFDLVPVARDLLIDHMQDGILVLDSSLRVVDINPAACRILITNKNEALGRSIAALPPIQRAWFNGLAPGGSQRFEFQVQGGDGPSPYELQASFVGGSGASPGVYLVVLRDIHERRKIEEKLKYLAVTDPLTGVFNRRRVLELARREIERARKTGAPVSVILLDVDNLKPVNDNAGHRAGDRVLEEVARRCQAGLRKGDIFGRYGGDEFIAMLPETPPETALLVAERLRRYIEEFSIPGQAGHFNVTVSIGVTVVCPDGAISLDILLEQADRALYQAKAAGRNCIIQY